MPSTLPKISIITPSYNQGQYIEATILSILNQNYPDLEYIIIDGGSTDGTIEVIKKYEKHLKFWVIEADKGQAHAINKGLTHCTGAIFNWINSDDLLADDALHIIAKAYNNQPEASIVGNVFNFFNGNIDNGYLFINRDINFNKLKTKFDGGQYHQPGVWYNLKNLKQFGYFNEKYHFGFDHDHYIGYIQAYPTVYYTNKTLVLFRLHESSKSVASSSKFILDKMSYLSNHIQKSNDSLIQKFLIHMYEQIYYEFLITKITLSKKPIIYRVLLLLKCLKYCFNKPLSFRFILGALKKIVFNYESR